VDEAWLNTVRIARDCGDISSLLPPGVTSLLDCPFPLWESIRLALYFLSFEELESKERPPKHIWLDADRMTAHWAEVKRNREARTNGGIDTSGMDENPLLKQMMGRTSGR
jgi:hypothetical protein